MRCTFTWRNHGSCIHQNKYPVQDNNWQLPIKVSATKVFTFFGIKSYQRNYSNLTGCSFMYMNNVETHKRTMQLPRLENKWFVAWMVFQMLQMPWILVNICRWYSNVWYIFIVYRGKWFTADRHRPFLSTSWPKKFSVLISQNFISVLSKRAHCTCSGTGTIIAVVGNNNCFICMTTKRYSVTKTFAI